MGSADRQKRNERCGAESDNHDGLYRLVFLVIFLLIFLAVDQKRAATTIGCGAVVVTGEPLYWKVPTPGRLPSGAPANEEPASTKAKARMKLSVRMILCPSSVAGGAAVVVAKLITMRRFARDAPKAENGFVFVRIVSSRARRRNIQQKIPVFSEGSRGA
ncbi:MULTISPECIES: hypothetical protein [Bradyrhizobium]|uniref:hypothetical protein n=1 Tax=Bradyrhizobium TaxID=374 RepID=UPI001912513A|nr:hypothetical protein [Bradyrhizobium japonicum]